MSFGGGKSKQSSKESSITARDAFGMDTSVSGGKSSNFNIANAMGQAWNQAMNSGQTFVDKTQQPFLSKLYSEAMKTYQAQPGQVAAAQKIVNPLITQGNKAYGNLINLSDPTKQIAAQEASLSSGLQDLFKQGTIGVNAAATNAGAFGGGRQAIEQAALGGEIAKAFTQGRGDIVANANTTALNAAQAAGPMASNLATLGMAPETLRFAGLQGLQGLLGGPTVLSSNFGTSGGGSTDRSSSFGGGKANNFANSFGINFDKMRSLSNASASGKRSDFNMGFI